MNKKGDATVVIVVAMAAIFYSIFRAIIDLSGG